MKKGIHPKIYKDAVVKCACGSTFSTISTLPEINVEICSECHPFYTGQRKFVDTERRIDKFTRKQKLAEEKMKRAKETEKSKKEKKATAQEQPLTLKEMLEKAKSEEINTSGNKEE